MYLKNIYKAYRYFQQSLYIKSWNIYLDENIINIITWLKFFLLQKDLMFQNRCKVLGQTSYLFVDKSSVWVIKIFIHIILQTSDSLISKVVSYIWEHSLSQTDISIFISQCYNLVWVDFVHLTNLVEIIAKLFCNRKFL